MELNDKSKIKPRVPVGVIYDKKGNVKRIRLAEFEPGMVIERCGRRYRIDAKGQQRRIG